MNEKKKNKKKKQKTKQNKTKITKTPHALTIVRSIDKERKGHPDTSQIKREKNK